MIMTVVETISERVAQLAPERQEEVLDFVDFLAARESEPGYDTAWAAELRRRIVEIESERVQGIPAEQVIREMRAKYG
jgi:putative addiction module component (TIGR02574 family)